mmetsp:Transcript_27827/g.81443  ORF Transcript_27827/g.81443 Transcript_27827/m.81443 type:complete len:265 (-) Transcript_27827:63-857(-)
MVPTLSCGLGPGVPGSAEDAGASLITVPAGSVLSAAAATARGGGRWLKLFIFVVLFSAGLALSQLRAEGLVLRFENVHFPSEPREVRPAAASPVLRGASDPPGGTCAGWLLARRVLADDSVGAVPLAICLLPRLAQCLLHGRFLCFQFRNAVVELGSLVPQLVPLHLELASLPTSAEHLLLRSLGRLLQPPLHGGQLVAELDDLFGRGGVTSVPCLAGHVSSLGPAVAERLEGALFVALCGALELVLEGDNGLAESQHLLVLGG